jgi:hypothetical protein
VTVAVSVSVPGPSSVTSTVSSKVGFVSKSTSDTSATVISPVVELMSKASPVLPAVMAYVRVSPSSSVADGVPTDVPWAEFSSRP